MNSDNDVTIRREELEELRQDAAILRSLQQIARIGWWKIDFNTREFYCSKMLANLFGFERLPVLSQDFRELIHPEHRQRVIRSFEMFPEIGYYEEHFPVKTRIGYQWIHAKLDSKEIDEEGHLTAQGYFQYMTEEDAAMTRTGAAQWRLKELLTRHNELSQSLHRLLKNPDTDRVITEILNNLLEQFDGDRAYIFEYDWEHKTQTCQYEVLKPGISSEIDNLQALPMSATKWWTAQLTRQVPIILNDLATLPSDAQDVKKILEPQNIRSIIAVPLMAGDHTWGYLGIDMVGRSRIWHETDQQWFLSIANVISVCLQLKRSETNVRREKEYFRSLYMHMPIGYAELKVRYGTDGQPEDYTFIDMNPAFRQISHIGEGTNLNDFLYLMQDDIRTDFDEVTTKNTIVSGKIIRGTGDKAFSLTLFSSEKDLCTLLLSDVTEHNRAQKALQRSEAMLQNIYDNIPVGIEIYDKSGNLVDVNKEELKIFGFTAKEQILGKNLFTNPNVPELEKTALRAGRNIEMTTDYDFDLARRTYEYTGSLTGIKNLYIRTTVLRNGDGEADFFIVIIVDNTESLLAKHKLNDIEYLYNYMAEAAKIGLCRWRPDQGSFTASEQWYSNMGIPGPAADIQSAYVHTHPDDYRRLTEFFRQAVDGKAQYFRDAIRVKDQNGWQWLRCNYRVKAGETTGNPIEIIGMNLDITELKQTEIRLLEAKQKAEESDRLKSAFLANMSHEIRTPLNAIVGFSSLLPEADADEQKEYIGIIQRNNDHLLQLISDILDLSKIEAGILEVSCEKLEINSLCGEIINGYRSDDRRQVTISFAGATAAEYYIESDRNKLVQILSNFINNALKFTDTGNITLGYELKTDDKIEFYVQDTGIGIAPEQQKAIFNRFEKVSTFSQGTGLGLAICKTLVEKLGGEIGVHSELGKGSRFYFTIGCKPDRPVSSQNTPLSTQEKSEHMKPKILVAEDTESNYMFVRVILKNDYELVRAHDGVEAVDLFFKEQPDVVMMDIKMPNMDGLEATRQIRQKDKTTPIIAVTAFAFADDRENAIEAGCTDYMTKPINAPELKKLLASLTGNDSR